MGPQHPPLNDTEITARLRAQTAAVAAQWAIINANYNTAVGHLTAREAEAIAKRIPGLTGIALESAAEGDDQGGSYNTLCVAIEIDAEVNRQALAAAPPDPDETDTGEASDGGELLDEDEALDTLRQALEGVGCELIEVWGEHVTRSELAALAAAAGTYAAELPAAAEGGA